MRCSATTASSTVTLRDTAPIRGARAAVETPDEVVAVLDVVVATEDEEEVRVAAGPVEVTVAAEAVETVDVADAVATKATSRARSTPPTR